jgi:hypothetical protein
LQGKSALKAASAVNVRHILCEKHSRSTEALQKIKVGLLRPIIATVDLPSHQDGQPFNRVAQEYSEDKAKGVLHYCGILSSIYFRRSWWQSWLDGERKHGRTLPRRGICSYTIYG